jgi:hypothetical protein
MHPNLSPSGREPWNKGKIVGQKAPLKLKEVWAIRKRVPEAALTAIVSSVYAGEPGRTFHH